MTWASREGKERRVVFSVAIGHQSPGLCRLKFPDKIFWKPSLRLTFTPHFTAKITGNNETIVPKNPARANKSFCIKKKKSNLWRCGILSFPDYWDSILFYPHKNDLWNRKRAHWLVVAADSLEVIYVRIHALAGKKISIRRVRGGQFFPSVVSARFARVVINQLCRRVKINYKTITPPVAYRTRLL